MFIYIGKISLLITFKKKSQIADWNLVLISMSDFHCLLHSPFQGQKSQDILFSRCLLFGWKTFLRTTSKMDFDLSPASPLLSLSGKMMELMPGQTIFVFSRLSFPLSKDNGPEAKGNSQIFIFFMEEGERSIGLSLVQAAWGGQMFHTSLTGSDHIP